MSEPQMRGNSKVIIAIAVIVIVAIFCAYCDVWK